MRCCVHYSTKNTTQRSFRFCVFVYNCSSISSTKKTTFLLVFDSKEAAAFHLNDLELILPTEDVFFYPGSYRRPYEIEETDNANVLLRAEVLNRINSRKKPALLVTYHDALFEKVLSKKEFNRNTFKINSGDNLSIEFINNLLFEYHFKRVDFVTDPGEFSVRGGIVDVFSFAHDTPYRIEFFGDEVESIRTFDIASQLSLNTHNALQIIPNIEHKHHKEKRIGFLEYISKETIIFLFQFTRAYGVYGFIV